MGGSRQRRWVRQLAWATGLALLAAWPARGSGGASYVYVAGAEPPVGIIERAAVGLLSPELQVAAVPFRLQNLLVPPEPSIRPYEPYRIDPILPDYERAYLAEVAEGLRLTRTGRLLYAYLRDNVGPLSGTLRSLKLTVASLGVNGDVAVLSGTPPAFVVTFNRDMMGNSYRAMVPKFAHELIHLHDYIQQVERCVAIEVSAHAADAAVAFEGNQATTGSADGPYTTLLSLPEVYQQWYVPFRRQPSVEGHQSYWRELMRYVLEQRPYRTLYRDGQGRTVWNSPPGQVSDRTYVPYDPTFGLPGGR